MRPKKPETTEGDCFAPGWIRSSLKHELVQLGAKVDWAWIDREIAPLHSEKGRPGIEGPFRLLLLKHIYGLSEEGVCERWVYDPYFQHFTGFEFFQHEFPHERSDLSHWRKRLGDKLELLLAEIAQDRRPAHRPARQLEGFSASVARHMSGCALPGHLRVRKNLLRHELQRNWVPVALPTSPRPVTDLQALVEPLR